MDSAGEGEDDTALPQKGINMMIKDNIPDVRIANDARDLLNQFCVEFIKHVSKEAQRLSNLDQRKTIFHEHVIRALKNLGFPPDYLETVPTSEAADSVLAECKNVAAIRRKRKKSTLDKCGIPEDELYRMQMELIEKARAEQQDMEASQIAEFQRQVLQGQASSVEAGAGGGAGQEGSSNSDELDEDYDAAD